MRETVEKDSQELVELLAQDYRSRHRSELDQKVARISQDFVSRGLFNTTARVSDQLQAEASHVEGLVDHVLASLEAEVSRISLGICRQTLLRIVEGEYRRIIAGIGGKLIASNLASADIIGGFERGLLKRCEETKKRVEVKFEAWERREALHRRTREKWYQNRNIQAALVTAGVALGVAVMSWLLTSSGGTQDDVYSAPEAKTQTKDAAEIPSRVPPAEPNALPEVDSSRSSVETGVRRAATPVKDETMFRSDDTSVDVSQSDPRPVLKIQDKALPPEEPNGQVIRPEQNELLRKKASGIKPDPS